MVKQKSLHYIENLLVEIYLKNKMYDEGKKRWEKVMTNCGPVMLLPSHVCFRLVMFLLKIILIIWWTSIEWPTSIKRPLLLVPWGWPFNGGSSVLVKPVTFSPGSLSFYLLLLILKKMQLCCFQVTIHKVTQWHFVLTGSFDKSLWWWLHSFVEFKTSTTCSCTVIKI